MSVAGESPPDATKPDPHDVLQGIGTQIIEALKALQPYREIDQRLIIADYLLREALGQVERTRRTL